jgi:hypothetical protein
MKSFFKSINIIILEEQLDAVENNLVSFQPFQWMDAEDRDTPRAISHLEQELKKFGVKFGRGNYKMYDVHSDHTLLSLDDEKMGTPLSGGTDLIIAPFGIAMESVIQNSCVAFEFKTKEAVDKKQGFASFVSEATMELIASNYHSNQLTLVVLTDLCTDNCMLLTFIRETGKLAIMKYFDVTLDQMAIFVSSHLQQNCFAIRNYSLPDFDDGIKESESIKKEWKKLRVSNFTSSLQWEHFQEMMDDAPLGSKKRAMVIKEHFRQLDLSYLSMFS